ncbi:MAG: PKD domain-containing protein [Myxococcota bacterium]
MANAGEDRMILPPYGVVVLDGSKSYDPNGDVLTYRWAFVSVPAGSTAMLSNANTVSPSFVPDRSGDYVISLIVNDGKVDSDPDIVVVKAIAGNSTPVASLKIDPTTARINTYVLLDGSGSYDRDGGIVSYQFDIYNSSDVLVATIGPAAKAEVFYKFTTSDTFTVKLTVRDNDGATSSDYKQVIITPNIKPVALLSVPDYSEINEPVVIDAGNSYDSDGYIVTYEFTFSDSGTISQTDSKIIHSFSLSGNQSISLRVKDNDNVWSDTIKVPIYIIPNRPPVAAFNGPSEGLINQSLEFDGSTSKDEDGYISSYKWEVRKLPAGVFTQIGTNYLLGYIFTSDGQYELRLTVTDNKGAQSSISRYISIYTMAQKYRGPTARFSADPYNATPNQDIKFDATSSDGGDGIITSYNWAFGDTSAGSGAVVFHQYSSEGSYNVSLTVTSTFKDGSTASNTMSQIVRIESADLEITSLTPNSGPLGGGTLVTMKGKGFSPWMQITIGGMNVVGLNYYDPTTVTFYTPQNSSYGPKDVIVYSGGNSAVLIGGFTYLEPQSGASKYCWNDSAPLSSIGFYPGDDEIVIPITLPFNFKFFGIGYNSGSNLYISPNGYASFCVSQSYNTPYPVPDPNNPPCSIMPFFMDMRVGLGGGIYYFVTGSAPNRALTIRWINMEPVIGIGKFTFETTLYESSNNVAFQYLNTYDGNEFTLADGSNATVGLQGPSGILGVEASRNTPTEGYAPGGRVWAFYPSGNNYSILTDLSFTQFSTYPYSYSSAPSSTNITIDLTQRLDSATVNATTVNLSDQTYNTILNCPITGTYDLIRIGDGTSCLFGGHQYRVTVKTGVKSITGVDFTANPTETDCGGGAASTNFSFIFNAEFSRYPDVQFPAGSDLTEVTFTEDNKYVFVSDSANNFVYKIDPNNGQILAKTTVSDRPIGIASRAVSGKQWIFAVAYSTNRFYTIDASNLNTTSVNVPSGCSGPFGLASNPSNNYLIMTCRDSNNIYRVDIGNPTNPVFALVNLNNVIDCLGNSVTCNSPRHPVISRNGRIGFVPCGTTQRVINIDLTGAIGGNSPDWGCQRSSNLGGELYDVAVDSGDQRVFVTSPGNNRIYELDYNNLSTNNQRGFTNGTVPLGINISTPSNPSFGEAVMAVMNGTGEFYIMDINNINNTVRRFSIGNGAQPVGIASSTDGASFRVIITANGFGSLLRFQ